MKNKQLRDVMLSASIALCCCLSATFSLADSEKVPNISSEGRTKEAKHYMEKPEMATIPSEKIKAVRTLPDAEEKQMATIPGAKSE